MGSCMRLLNLDQTALTRLCNEGAELLVTLD